MPWHHTERIAFIQHGTQQKLFQSSVSRKTDGQFSEQITMMAKSKKGERKQKSKLMEFQRDAI